MQSINKLGKMSFQVHLILVAATLAALAAVAHSGEHPLYMGMGMGQGLVSDSMDHLDQDMTMDDPSRRQLSSAGYISYGALMRNKVPCDQKGQSYYNCRAHEQANPYNRGCTRVTSCARSTVWFYFLLFSCACACAWQLWVDFAFQLISFTTVPFIYLFVLVHFLLLNTWNEVSSYLYIYIYVSIIILPFKIEDWKLKTEMAVLKSNMNWKITTLLHVLESQETSLQLWGEMHVHNITCSWYYIAITKFSRNSDILFVQHQMGNECLPLANIVLIIFILVFVLS